MEADGGSGGGLQTEAVDGGGGLGGVDAVVEFEAGFDGVLEDEGAGRGGGVVDDVGELRVLAVWRVRTPLEAEMLVTREPPCWSSVATWTAWSAA